MSATTTTSAFPSPPQDLAATVITSFPLRPLTTTFTPPDHCRGIYFNTGRGLHIIDNDFACLPDDFTTGVNDYFSPGIACPSGYSTMCYEASGVRSITTVTCCPFRDDILLSCVRNPDTLDGAWRSHFCTWSPGERETNVFVTMSDGARTYTETVGMGPGGGINAYGVRMVYQASDLLTSSTGGGGESSSEQQPTPTPSEGGGGSGGSDEGESSGLSEGATVAIGVAIPLVVLFATIGGWFLWRRRRRRKGSGGREGQQVIPAQYYHTHPAALGAGPLPPPPSAFPKPYSPYSPHSGHHPHYPPPTPRHEMDAQGYHAASELPAHQTYYELSPVSR